MNDIEDKKYRAYLPYWWEFLKHRICFGKAGQRIQGGTRENPFPQNHEIWPAFSFQKSKDKPRRQGLVFFPDSKFPEKTKRDEQNYLDAFEQWMLREIASDSLCPENKLKLFIAETGIKKVFITEEELEGDPAAAVFLKEQQDLFEHFLGWRPDD